jgi:hypothetical protein
MNPSKLLSRFLRTGEKPTSQRDTSAILDESRSILASQLPTTGETIMNFTKTELDSINPKGGNVLDQMHKVYLEKQSFKPSSTPSTMKTFTSPRKTSAPPTAKPVARTAPTAAKPAPAPVASKPAVIHRVNTSATAPTAPKPAAAPANPLADASDRFVIQSAIHRSAPEADRIAARAELDRRGINITPEGIRTQSMRGGRAVRLANLKK